MVSAVAAVTIPLVIVKLVITSTVGVAEALVVVLVGLAVTWLVVAVLALTSESRSSRASEIWVAMEPEYR